ncbi:uncharacterized protein LOC120292746 [Eucalyptus grandis]|uniref:uncharacterized protein LOC120292746 n=1 Tax=Eucalyptus grandis TaxID=71139 RepID=UPI00192ECA7D|nr:uncharacterized protein LOC120292746 [Eucalyptus grandis]
MLQVKQSQGHRSLPTTRTVGSIYVTFEEAAFRRLPKTRRFGDRIPFVRGPCSVVSMIRELLDSCLGQGVGNCSIWIRAMATKDTVVAHTPDLPQDMSYCLQPR